MGVLEQVTTLKNQGFSEQEIVDNLQQQGISPKEITDAINQSQIKSAVSDTEPPIAGAGSTGALPGKCQRGARWYAAGYGSRLSHCRDQRSRPGHDQ